MRVHDHFEWDETKSVENLRKHRISFEDASYVLADEDGDLFHIDEYDEAHSVREERYVTTASHPDDRSIILRIVWADRSSKGHKITRIISARAALTREVQLYAEEIHARQSRS